MSQRQLPTDPTAMASLLRTLLDRVYQIESQSFGGYVTGDMKMWPVATAPFGWLACDGTSYPRIGVYAALFDLIGVTYGSVDGAHFNVPDFVGRVPVGIGTNADVNALGKNEGSVAASRTPKHNTSLGGALTVGSLTGTINQPGDVYPGSTTGPRSGGFGDDVQSPGVTISGAPGLGTLAAGPGGSRPNDTPAFLTVAIVIKL